MKQKPLKIAIFIYEWMRTSAVCMRVFLLGEARLLTGIKATTHGASTSDLTKYKATYQPARFVQSGKIITAAGVSAGIDMALYLAAQLRGEEVAKAIQLAIEYAPHPRLTPAQLKKPVRRHWSDRKVYSKVGSLGNFRSSTLTNRC